MKRDTEVAERISFHKTCWGLGYYKAKTEFLSNLNDVPSSPAFILTIVFCCYTLPPGQEVVLSPWVMVSDKEERYELPCVCR
jgi:hypothetical protein